MKLQLQVLRMTSRNRLVAVGLVLLMLASTVVLTAPAATAQDGVPTRPEVTLEPVPNLRQRLFARFADTDAGTPNCADATARTLALTAAEDPSPAFPRAACPFTVTIADTLGGEVAFSTPFDLRVNRRINFTGNDSFVYHHSGAVPADLRLTISVRTDGGTTIATGTLIGSDDNEYTVPLVLAGPTANTGRVAIEANRNLTLAISPTAVSDPTAITPAQLRYQIDDTATFLEIRADDAVRAAVWITDEKNNIRNVFAPIPQDTVNPAERDRRIVGHFALQSAFGLEDASLGNAPNFTILLGGHPIPIAEGGRTLIQGVQNNSASVTALGVRVWSFPTDRLVYRGFLSGEYTLSVSKAHHIGDPILTATTKKFSITAQSVRLEPFVDSRAPTLIETQAHIVAPGQSTTYILAVSNNGSVNDTFTINLTAPNAPAGWGAAIGGPDVQARRIFVPAGEARVFTVTVNAPFAASGQVIHLVNVTSTIDPGARSRDLTLVTTVGADVIREVGLVFLARDLTIDPGVETHFPVYVWNRGTRAANVSLEIHETTTGGWTADLAFGNANVDRLVLSSIQPGDIAEARLEMTGPVNQAISSHPITLNATHQDVAGVSVDRTLTFALRQTSGVTVQVLSEVGANAHVAELSANAQLVGPPGAKQEVDNCDNPAIGCRIDGADGLWYRMWITNTGKLTETFDLTMDSFSSNCPAPTAQNPDPAPPVFPSSPGGDFGFYTRRPSGGSDAAPAVEILPGETAEVYLYVNVTSKFDACTSDGANDPETETLDFVAQARGRSTGATGRASIHAEARNSDERTMGVYLEAVARKDTYASSRPYVELGNATKRSVIAGIDPGRNATYYVRMTNLAAFRNFTERVSNPTRDVARETDFHVYVDQSSVDYDGGWNVSIRPVLDGGVTGSNSIQNNPYRAEYNFSSENTQKNPVRWEAWFDRELEVVVTAPSVENGTALAGLRHEFNLIAESNNTRSRSTLEIVTIINSTADVRPRGDPTVLAHPGKPGTFLLYVTNNGSAAADVTLRAAMDNATANAGAWQVEPAAQRFPLPAYKNRTIAILVSPPAGSTQGAEGFLNVELEYAKNPAEPNVTSKASVRPRVEVVAPGTLTLTPGRTDATIGPGGTANYTMQLRNGGTLATQFRVSATPIPNWSVTASPSEGTLNPGESRTVVLVLIAPNDVTNDTRFASVVSVAERDAANNFDTAAFTVNILGGKALPRLSVPNLMKRVDRAGVQQFEVQVQNVGSAAGRLALEARAQDPSWVVGIVDSRGNNITGVQLNTNELVNINVTVRAPFNVPERVAVPVEIVAYSPDQTQSAKVTLSAEIHDYGVQLSLLPASKDALPGLPTEFTVRLRNTGNDNDTLNLSLNLVDLPEWSVQLSSEEVRLEPNQEAEIRATIRSPTGPLPTPRSYTFPFWVGTRGGQAVNISKNMTLSAVVTVPNYRSYDVDRDAQLEIAVDLDKRASNGFEEFREIFTEGIATQVVAKGLLDQRTTYFLDVPRDRPYDGVADTWFNPETVYAYEIQHAPDVNGDGTPEYLLDVDRNGKIDQAFDTEVERFRNVQEIKIYADERIQYLVDTNGDGKADRFYDPEGKAGEGLVTRTQSAADLGTDYVGVDIDDDERVDYYYNTRTEQATVAEVGNIGTFARDYWYFFVGFAAMVLLTVFLLVRRRKSG